jgi:DNA-binding NarL/FixJ family response regulator
MKRIFMLSSHPLFSQGVESLLRRETGLEIVGREADADQALERIKELRPDVVVLDSADLRDPMPVVMRIFREGVGAKVISLNLKDDTMHVYRGEQRVVKQVEDLVKVIKAGASGKVQVVHQRGHGEEPPAQPPGEAALAGPPPGRCLGGSPEAG